MAIDILVIGKTGQLAQCLAEKAGKVSDMTFEFWGRDRLDLAVATDIADQIAERAPDFVINSAAYTAVDKAEDEPDLAMRINGKAPGELAMGAADCGATIIHVSTDYVFDGSLDRPYREDDPTNPLGVYGRTKLAGEEAVANANPKHVIVRTSWVYSVYGNNFVKTMLRLGQERDELSVVNDQVGNPTSAHDLAEALISVVGKLAAEGGKSPYGTYHLSGTGTASWHEFADAIFKALEHGTGKRPRLKAITSAEFQTKAKRPSNSRLDCTRFDAAFDFTMPAWENSMQTVVSRLLSV